MASIRQSSLLPEAQITKHYFLRQLSTFWFHLVSKTHAPHTLLVASWLYTLLLRISLHHHCHRCLGTWMTDRSFYQVTLLFHCVLMHLKCRPSILTFHLLSLVWAGLEDLTWKFSVFAPFASNSSGLPSHQIKHYHYLCLRFSGRTVWSCPWYAAGWRPCQSDHRFPFLPLRSRQAHLLEF